MLDDKKPYIIEVTNIKYYYLIAKLPNMSRKSFYNFVKDILNNDNLSYEYVKMKEGESFTFNKEFDYLKVIGKDRDI